MTTDHLESFSESQLVDCSSSYGNKGCNGGLMDNAFKYVKDHGILHEKDYPYVSKQGPCKKNTGPFTISGYVSIKSCHDLTLALQHGPVSVAVDALFWADYKSGIFSSCGK